jgi:hypothetical protein
MTNTNRIIPSLSRRQRGVSTLVITLLLLVIISLVVLFSTSVGFFEQRTATNENRARIAEQAAETGINMAGEYIKANRDFVIAKTTGGWLAGTAGVAGWKSCSGISNTATLGGQPHPCRSESDSDSAGTDLARRRANLWFYTTDGVGATLATTRIPYGAISNVGGAAAFPSAVSVQAVLCRIDTTLATPACQKLPIAGNRIAITFISTATLTDENTTAVIKETWASFSSSSFSSAVPLVASGIVKGLGNANIVASPNAGGYGVAASMWSPNNIGFGTKNTNACADGSSNGGGGIGSGTSCQIEDYIFNTPVIPSSAGVKQGCGPDKEKCDCSDVEGRYLSGHSGQDKDEGIDVLDIDNNNGPLPDTTFFPGTSCSKAGGLAGDGQRDDPNDGLDDSLFEWVFGVDVVTEGVGTTKDITSVNQNCTPNADCAVNALLENLSALPKSCVELNALGQSASGLYYVSDVAGCTFSSQIGKPTQSVVVVVENEADVNNLFYGLLFVRSKINKANIKITGGPGKKIFGALVVEGDIDIAGAFDVVYDDVSVSTDPFTFPKNAKFARVPGSWLDATEGF